jgi:hypothetical protein
MSRRVKASFLFCMICAISPKFWIGKMLGGILNKSFKNYSFAKFCLISYVFASGGITCPVPILRLNISSTKSFCFIRAKSTSVELSAAYLIDWNLSSNYSNMWIDFFKWWMQSSKFSIIGLRASRPAPCGSVISEDFATKV